MAEVEVSTTPLVVMVEDSPDTRLFIELSSHAADLTEAHHALELAQQEHDPDSMLADATPYLVGFAVVAYGRSILHSNVRGRLTDHVDVPEHLTDVHEQIKSYRNATIAPLPIGAVSYLPDGIPRNALLAGARPTVLNRAADDFDPRSKRTRYPTRQTLYWDQRPISTE